MTDVREETAGDPQREGEATSPDVTAALNAPAPPGDAVAAADPESPGDDRYLRLAADFENFRRRKNQELADRSRYASETAARELLPVLDNLRRALEHASEADPQDLLGGLELVMREFERALRELGVEPIGQTGERFDPSIHEALGGEERDDVDEDSVLTVLQPGYRLHDRVLRPALVRVAHPSASAAGSS